MRTGLFVLLLLTTVLSSCQHVQPKYIYNEGFVYGTIYHFVYENPKGNDLHEEIKAKLSEYNLMFSTFDSTSVIAKINNNQETKLTPEFIKCFNRAIEISEITDGAFDITAGPMVNAWGFGPESKQAMTQEKVDSLKEITGYKKIRLEKGRIIKDIPNMKLDMSAIAKGYTCDLIGDFLKRKGCKNLMVDIGGEIVALGKNEKGREWTIGISDPSENAFFASSDYVAALRLTNHALATSGNYRNFYVEDGKKYAHTIDPKTGYPVQHSILSSTVLADNCMTADAFATAFMVIGLEKGIELAKQIPEIEVYFIYADSLGNNQIYMSENFERHLVK
jgi:FAD:protein FMN transferase